MVTLENFTEPSKQLFDNTAYIIEIKRFINDNRVNLVKTNQETINKWKELLKVFED